MQTCYIFPSMFFCRGFCDDILGETPLETHPETHPETPLVFDSHLTEKVYQPRATHG